MKLPHLPLRIQPMTLADIPQVVAVEQASYAMTWPQKAYDYELTQNQLAHYFVLRHVSQPVIIGLAGIWLMADEAHINTIAVHPRWRGLGLGEWLLITLLTAAQELGAATSTLEVRPSNRAAIDLYHKYAFAEVGRRPRYYSDNGEDALILTTPPLTLPDYQAMFTQRQAALSQRLQKTSPEKFHVEPI
jgi:ribosomal-protein-alanine N-acetyltransferase